MHLLKYSIYIPSFAFRFISVMDVKDAPKEKEQID